MKRSEAATYAFSGYRLDCSRRLLLGPTGQPIAAIGRVFDTLAYLVEHSDRLVTKRELLDSVWGDTVVEENNLTQAISTLRQLLGERPEDHRFIVTVPARGYRFVAPTIRDDPQQLPAPAPETAAGNSVARVPRVPWSRHLVAVVTALIGVLIALAWQTHRTAANESAVKSIAVLPFRSLVPESRDQALELGMADALILRLSDSQELVVRPLSSIRKYVGLEQDAVAAGRALGVDAVLDCSIYRSASAIRVTARLVRVRDGKPIWIGRLDQPWTNAFAIQDAIAEQVANALALRLTDSERARLTRHYTESDEAYRLYLLGRYHFSKLIPPEIYRSIEFFQQALIIDPNYALAYAGLAESFRALPISADVRPLDVLPKAKAAALKALAIDPGLGQAQATICFLQVWFDWDWEAAREACKRALAMNPHSPEAHRANSVLLSDLGRHEEAIREARRASELDPLSLITTAIEAHVLLYAGRNDEAIARADQTLDLEPKFWIAWLFRGKALLNLGRYKEALAAFEKSREFSGGISEAVSLVGYSLAILGDRAGAAQALAELQSRAASKYVPPLNMAMLLNGLGESKASLDWLERAYAERDVRLTFMRIDRKWDPLRTDPRFKALAARMKLD